MIFLNVRVSFNLWEDFRGAWGLGWVVLVEGGSLYLESS